ncbi:MAG: acetoacetate decarboxylase family protein [Bacillota bacterium]
MLKGFSSPMSPTGRSSLAPTPPWHYAGELLVIEYWADPAAAASYLPQGLEPDEDAGYCTAHFAEWQAVTSDGQESLDPVRSQYTEFFLLLAARWRGEKVNYCPYIFVSQDASLARGWAQGLPKQIGQIHMTRAYGVSNPATPTLAPGGRFGATLSWNGRRLVEAKLTLMSEQQGRAGLPARPYVGLRVFPDLAQPGHDRPMVMQLVRGGASNVQVPAGWTGNAELQFLPCDVHELADLKPLRVGPGHRFSMGLTISTLTVLADLRT